MKKISFYTLLIVVVFAICAYGPGPSSAGAPASHTGAPGESTCAESGCHDDNIANSGSTKLSLEFEETPEKLIPGKTYNLKVILSDEHTSRFGFQILALEGETEKNAGSFSITDSARTQLVNNSRQLQDRNYVTYTFNGTDAIKKGYSEWKLRWTAPNTKIKSVDFYLAGVAANDDMSDKGDIVYTKKIKVKY